MVRASTLLAAPPATMFWTIWCVTAAGQAVVASEGTDGLHVRADDFVYRMSANDVAPVSLRASRFGQPLANAEIAVALKAEKLTMLVSEQNLAFAAAIADSVVLLERGVVRHRGAMAELMADEELRMRYLAVS